MKPLFLLPLLLALPSCAVIDRVLPDALYRAPAAAPVGDGPGQAAARSPDVLDRTSAAEKAAALSAGGQGGAELGAVAVSLGDPAQPGFWLRSALVAAPAKGRVVTEDGASIAVDLLPGSGAAQLSLSAFRALGLPLTGLPRVTIYASD